MLLSLIPKFEGIFGELSNIVRKLKNTKKTEILSQCLQKKKKQARQAGSPEAGAEELESHSVKDQHLAWGFRFRPIAEETFQGMRSDMRQEVGRTDSEVALSGIP